MYRFGLFCFVLLFSTTSYARNDGRQNQFPHGNTITCNACHTQPNRGITEFGFDAYEAASEGPIDWPKLAAMDSDGDGYSNGLELGDPDANWRVGDPAPSGDYWNPGFKDENPCGNDKLESVEDCDGGVGNTVTCQSLGLGIGKVRCSDLCKFDTSACFVCGDGEVDPNTEECDGSNFDGESCQTLGFKEGTLACNTLCKIDDSDCSGVADTCGDEVIQMPEECDGSDLGGKTCESLELEGGMLSCSTTCRYYTGECIGKKSDVIPKTTTPNESSDSTEIIGEGRCNTLGRSNSVFCLLVFLAIFSFRKSRN